MAEQTAVEWFSIKTWRLKIHLENKEITVGEYANTYFELYQQAKEMEKEQIIDAYKSDRYPCSDEDAQQYYNETYKTQAQ
jgi:hypothetical protein